MPCTLPLMTRMRLVVSWKGLVLATRFSSSELISSLLPVPTQQVGQNIQRQAAVSLTATCAVTDSGPHPCDSALFPEHQSDLTSQADDHNLDLDVQARVRGLLGVQLPSLLLRRLVQVNAAGAAVRGRAVHALHALND